MTPSPATVALELALPAEDIAGLRRHLGRARSFTLAWHDTGDHALCHAGLAALCWREGRLERWWREDLDPSLPPGAVAPRQAEAPAPGELAGVTEAAHLRPVQFLTGRTREGLAGDVALRLLEGQTDGGVRLVRLRLSGPVEEVTALGLSLAADGRLSVPLRPLSAEALALAGLPVPARRLGAPVLPAGLAPGAAFAQAAGHLLGTLLHHAPAAEAGQTGEPVHQMRVALRRLRALATVFRDAVECPLLGTVRPAMKALASALGPARDWDVFLEGTGRRVQAAFPAEAGVEALVQAASVRRTEAYAALRTVLAGPALRCFALQVAALVAGRPWEALAAAPVDDTAAFGAVVLERRLKRLRRQARGLESLPDEALHELRLKAKRLRYAAEVFAPLFPPRETSRFLRRLAALQETLGHLNDGAVAAVLMHALEGQGGAGHAGGLVRGFVAGRAGEVRQEIAGRWRRLRRAGRFWR